MTTKKPKKLPSASQTKAERNKHIPVVLPQSVVDDIDVIVKAEGTTRSELIRQAVKDFNFNYANNQLDQRQLKLEKQMKDLERGMRGLLTKSIRINGQVLWYLTTIWTHGVPGLPINTVPQELFDDMWKDSRQFASELLRTRELPLDESTHQE